MKPADVAETLDISIAALKSRLHRARLFVRQRLLEVAALPQNGRRRAPGGAVKTHDEFTCKRLILDSLVEYEDGSMPEPDRQALEAHLSHCPPCIVFLKSYRATGRTLRMLKPREIPLQPRRSRHELRARALRQEGVGRLRPPRLCDRISFPAAEDEFGPCATEVSEPRQVRKEAAIRRRHRAPQVNLSSSSAAGILERGLHARRARLENGGLGSSRTSSARRPWRGRSRTPSRKGGSLRPTC